MDLVYFIEKPGRGLETALIKYPECGPTISYMVLKNIPGGVMMKRFLLVLLVVTLAMILLAGASLAEGSFTFRGIPWLTTRAEVEEKLTGEGYRLFMQRNNIDIPDWYQTRAYKNEDTISEGGCRSNFLDASVAGYKADVDAYFWYPIVDGRVQRNPDSSQLYLANYRILDGDDQEQVYEDLLRKMKSIYGTPQTTEKDAKDDFGFSINTSGSLWTADDGSRIWLAKYKEFGQIASVKIWYAAPETTETLQALEAQIAKEIKEAEDAERERIKNNTDGL